MQNKIVLVGYMGSGKTTIGEYLSEKMNLPFFDLDKIIEENHNLSIPEIFKEKGEIYFRKEERNTLDSFLASKNEYILSVGGGTVCYGTTMESLKSINNLTIVYLKASIEELTKRLLSSMNSRPLISHLKSEKELHDFIRKHLFERNYYYNQAHISVSVDQGSISDQVDKIYQALI